MLISELEESVNLLKINLVNAKPGDCLLIQYEDKTQAGFKFVKDKLSPSGNLKLVPSFFMKKED